MKDDIKIWIIIISMAGFFWLAIISFRLDMGNAEWRCIETEEKIYYEVFCEPEHKITTQIYNLSKAIEFAQECYNKTGTYYPISQHHKFRCVLEAWVREP